MKFLSDIFKKLSKSEINEKEVSKEINFYIDAPSIEEISLYEIGSRVKMWTPPDRPDGHVYIYIHGSGAGRGKLGYVPVEFENIIKSHLAERRKYAHSIGNAKRRYYEASIVDIDEKGYRIKYRVLSDSEIKRRTND